MYISILKIKWLKSYKTPQRDTATLVWQSKSKKKAMNKETHQVERTPHPRG